MTRTQSSHSGIRKTGLCSSQYSSNICGILGATREYQVNNLYKCKSKIAAHLTNMSCFYERNWLCFDDNSLHILFVSTVCCLRSAALQFTAVRAEVVQVSCAFVLHSHGIFPSWIGECSAQVPASFQLGSNTCTTFTKVRSLCPASIRNESFP